MRYPTEMSKMKKHILPLWALVVIDTVALGAALCVFALFDHVLTFGPSSPVFEPTQETPTHSTSQDPSEKPTDEVWQGMFGKKFADKFADGDNVTVTDTEYRSHDIYVKCYRGRVNGSNYYVQDIYIRNPQNFRTAFSSGRLDGTKQTGLSMALENSAVCAINGDYNGFGMGDGGVVLRNGVLYRGKPDNDVLVMYSDGSMKDFAADRNRTVKGFDAQAELAAGAWQAWCFGPTLVRNGAIPEKWYSYINAANPRTALGYFEPGHYCFVTVDGRSDVSQGMKMRELAELMLGLGCRLAYNLDGGQSSTMTFGDKMINIAPPDEGVRKLSDILYITEVADE